MRTFEFSNIDEAFTYSRLARLFAILTQETGKTTVGTNELRNAVKSAAKWLIDPDRISLKVIGRPGTGKTTLVRAMQRFVAYYNQSNPTAQVPKISLFPALGIVDDILNARKSIMDFILCPVLAIDDVGVEATTVKYYGSEMMPISDIIMQRSNDNRPTIIVSNLDPDGFMAKYEARVTDRLRDMTTIVLDGESNRSNK